jgi:hypothetical protein
MRNEVPRPSFGVWPILRSRRLSGLADLDGPMTPPLSRKCAHPGCNVELVLILGTKLPAYCWDHMPGAEKPIDETKNEGKRGRR